MRLANFAAVLATFLCKEPLSTIRAVMEGRTPDGPPAEISPTPNSLRVFIGRINRNVDPGQDMILVALFYLFRARLVLRRAHD